MATATLTSSCRARIGPATGRISSRIRGANPAARCRSSSQACGLGLAIISFASRTSTASRACSHRPANSPIFVSKRFDEPVKLPLPANIHTPGRKIRANMWHYVDFDGDGALDVVVGVDDWQDYGWDDGYDADGKWLKGPLRGYVYLIRNTGTTDKPSIRRAANDRGRRQAGRDVRLAVAELCRFRRRRRFGSLVRRIPRFVHLLREHRQPHQTRRTRQAGVWSTTASRW